MEERKKRLGDLEGEEQQDVESDSRENEVVSKLQVPEKEDEPYAQDKLVATMNVDSDARLEEHTSFVSDDEFVKSMEFKSFLYHFKGNKLRDEMPDVTPENEAKMLRKLKDQINSKLENMTPQRGRQLLVEAGIILFPGRDLSAYSIFDSLFHSDKKDFKLDIQGVNDIFIGSRYDLDDEAMLLGPTIPRIRGQRL